MICFIHGLGATENCFMFLAEQLGYPALISYDSSAGLHRSIAEVQRQLPDGPVTLIGHSLGGLIATHIALNKTNEVQKLITISSPLGGSKAARLLKYFMPTYPVMQDITPLSPYIRRLQIAPQPCPVLSLASTEGGFPILLEPNDGTVEIDSMRALSYAKQVDIKANHFEILLKRETVQSIKEFLYD